MKVCALRAAIHAGDLAFIRSGEPIKRGGRGRYLIRRESLEQFGAHVLARDSEEALDCVNRLAPEHLHIATRDPEKLADRVHNAGAIFLGHYTPVALGDYAAGPSHVLPTGGTARFTSGLSANDFLRRTSVLHFTRAGLERMADDVRLLAEKEGLTGHAASVSVRLDQTKHAPSAGRSVRQSGRRSLS